MKSEWIEDFLSLAEEGSFSRAASARNVTQPAFSRRIQMLEAWLGVTLVDRQSHALRLTAAAERHMGDFRALLRDINLLRSKMRNAADNAVRIVFVTQHSLTMTHLSPITECLMQETDPRIDLLIRSENRAECVNLFRLGEADLMLCMEEPSDLFSRTMPQAVRRSVGTERLVPVSAAGPAGRPRYALGNGQVMRLFGFPPDTFLGRLLRQQCLDLLEHHQRVETVYKSVFLAGIKEMVLAGLGMCWLPFSLVRREIESGDLVVLADGLTPIDLELGLYYHAEPVHPDAIARILQLLTDQFPALSAEVGRPA